MRSPRRHSPLTRRREKFQDRHRSSYSDSRSKKRSTEKRDDRWSPGYKNNQRPTEHSNDQQFLDSRDNKRSTAYRCSRQSVESEEDQQFFDLRDDRRSPAYSSNRQSAESKDDQQFFDLRGDQQPLDYSYLTQSFDHGDKRSFLMCEDKQVSFDYGHKQQRFHYRNSHQFTADASGSATYGGQFWETGNIIGECQIFENPYSEIRQHQARPYGSHLWLKGNEPIGSQISEHISHSAEIHPHEPIPFETQCWVPDNKSVRGQILGKESCDYAEIEEFHGKSFGVSQWKREMKSRGSQIRKTDVSYPSDFQGRLAIPLEGTEPSLASKNAAAEWQVAGSSRQSRYPSQFSLLKSKSSDSEGSRVTYMVNSNQPLNEYDPTTLEERLAMRKEHLKVKRREARRKKRVERAIQKALQREHAPSSDRPPASSRSFFRSDSSILEEKAQVGPHYSLEQPQEPKAGPSGIQQRVTTKRMNTTTKSEYQNACIRGKRGRLLEEPPTSDPSEGKWKRPRKSNGPRVALKLHRPPSQVTHPPFPPSQSKHLPPPSRGKERGNVSSKRLQVVIMGNPEGSSISQEDADLIRGLLIAEIEVRALEPHPRRRPLRFVNSGRSADSGWFLVTCKDEYSQDWLLSWKPSTERAFSICRADSAPRPSTIMVNIRVKVIDPSKAIRILEYQNPSICISEWQYLGEQGSSGDWRLIFKVSERDIVALEQQKWRLNYELITVPAWRISKHSAGMGSSKEEKRDGGS